MISFCLCFCCEVVEETALGAADDKVALVAHDVPPDSVTVTVTVPRFTLVSASLAETGTKTTMFLMLDVTVASTLEEGVPAYSPEPGVGALIGSTVAVVTPVGIVSWN